MCRKIRVLLIDDHPVSREGLPLLIEQEVDFDVRATAADGRSAVEAITDYKPDIAIVDISLDTKDTNQLIEDIRAQFSGLPVRVLSL